jgi:hypothetical protein
MPDVWRSPNPIVALLNPVERGGLVWPDNAAPSQGEVE